MRFLFILLFAATLFAQENDTINLNLVEVANYSKYKKFSPKYKNIEQLKDHTNQGLTLLSPLQLPKQKDIEIFAIEILFQSTGIEKNMCNEFYYFSPIITKQISEKQNLLKEKWFVVDKQYTGRYIFPIHLKVNTQQASSYYIGIRSKYDNLFCPKENGYFDLIETYKKSDVYIHLNDGNMGFKKQELFGNYSLNYIIYYL